MTLTEFLTARLDEDEELARVSSVFVDGEFRDDVRALREVEAKRAIVRGCDPYGGGWDLREGVRDGLLRALASVYADHPDYAEDWRP